MHQSSATLSTKFCFAVLHHRLQSDSHLLALSALQCVLPLFVFGPACKSREFPNMGQPLYREASFDSALPCCLPKYRVLHNGFQMTFLE